MNFKDSSLNESDPHESSIAKTVNPPLFLGGKPERPLRLRSWWVCLRSLHETAAPKKEKPCDAKKESSEKESCLPSSCEVEQLEAKHIFFWGGEQFVSFKQTQ